MSTDEAKTTTANSKTEIPPPATAGPPATWPHSGRPSTNPARVSGKRNQTVPYNSAFAMTAGTKDAEMRSARVWMSGWRDCASLTVRTIP